jgi:hypothetical protein
MKLNITNEKITLCLLALLIYSIYITVTIYVKTNILNTYLKFPCIIINIVSIKMESNKCVILLQLWLKVRYSL